jgi:Flp pilus assembly protein TadD
MDGAVASLRKSLALDPSDPGAEDSLGTMLVETGQADEGYEHLRKAIEMAPKLPDPHNHLGWELAKTGRLDEAADELQEAITLNPASVEYRVNFGIVMGLRGDFAAAVAAFQKAVELSGAKDWRCLDLLAKAYNKTGRSDEAIQSEHQALDLVVQQHNDQLEKTLRGNLERYERGAAKGQAQ